MKGKIQTVFCWTGVAAFSLSLGFYDYINLSRIFAMISFISFILCAIAGMSEADKRKRTRCAGKPNESQKVESNKDLTIIIHRVLGVVKAGDNV